MLNGDGKEVEFSYAQMRYYVIHSDSGLGSGETFYVRAATDY